MKQFAKSLIARFADFINAARGYRFPAYSHERDRIKVLLFGIELDISNLLRKRLKPGMTVLDIGGNVGLICRICAKMVGPTGHVWTFEPDPYTRSFLDHNVRRFPNVTVSPLALSDEDTKGKLHIHPGSGTANSLLDFDASSHSIDVDCMTLDSFLERNPSIRPDCIKIDVEGAEPKVLRGMRRTIEQFPTLFLIVEFCPQNLANGSYSAGEYYALLQEMGFAVEMIQKNGQLVSVRDLEDLNSRLKGEIYCNLLCVRNH